MKQKGKNTGALEQTTTPSVAASPLVAKQKTATDSAEVVYRRFHQPVKLRELSGARSLQSLVSSLKEDGYGDKLRQARHEISEAFDAKDRPTLRSLRLKAGLSQSELAEKACLEQYQVSRYEAGQDYPRFDTLKRLRKALDVDPSTIWEAFDREET